MTILRRLAIGALVLATFLGTAAPSHGAGLYYSERGVRPLGRGGAFVAGADDLGAIAFNPAGLADAKSALLLDASYVNVGTQFTRRAFVNDAGGNPTEVTFPTVTASTPFIPIPTIAGSFSPSFQNNMFTFALGVHAPYAALSEWPATVNGQPAPSRYSLLTMEGSALAIVGAHVAFKPIEELRIGAGFEVLTGELATTSVFSAAPQDRLLSAPESPEYDALGKLKTKPIFAPSAHFGITAVPIKELRLGVAYHLPYSIDTPANLDITLPRAAAFNNARQEGNSVRMKTNLPGIFRAGVEVRPVDFVRIEAAYVREFWSVHESLAIEGTDLQFYNVTGFPSPFGIPPVAIPRRFHDSNSFRLGGEVAVLRIPQQRVGLDLRGGINYDQSAIPNDYLTPLTADLDRFTVAIGASLRPHPKWRFDIVYAHVFSAQAETDPRSAGVPPVNPVRGNPTNPDPINAGTYSNWGNIVGLGATVQF